MRGVPILAVALATALSGLAAAQEPFAVRYMDLCFAEMDAEFTASLAESVSEEDAQDMRYVVAGEALVCVDGTEAICSLSGDRAGCRGQVAEAAAERQARVMADLPEEIVASNRFTERRYVRWLEQARAMEGDEVCLSRVDEEPPNEGWCSFFGAMSQYLRTRQLERMVMMSEAAE